jgi:hypothetical protein
MKFNNSDLSSLLSIPLRRVHKFLVSCGWSECNSANLKNITIMRKLIDGVEEEILIPRDSSFADFNQRMIDVFKSISNFEKLELGEILNDLSNAASDILRIRVSGSGVETGNIPFLDEMAIKDALKKMLSAIACHVLDPRPFYKKLHRNESEQLIRSCKIGQSEKGSYVIKFYFPTLVNDELHKDSENKKQPFARQVAEQMMYSLKEAARFAENNLQPDISRIPFNANFCFGLVEMKPNEGKADFDFQVSWSEEIPVKANIPSKVTICDSYLSSISTLGELLKPQRAITQNDFVGKISTLNGFENEQNQMEGDIVVTLLVDDESKKAKAYLNPTFYSIACDAHKSSKYVRISGQLKEKPRNSILDEITKFEIIDT